MFNFFKIFKLLKFKSNVKIKNIDSYTELMIACSRFDNYEQVKSILYKNKNINIKGKNGNTALTIAAMFSTFRVVKFLLLNNADPNEMNNNMETALFNSINRANNQIDEFEIICIKN